MYPQVHCFLTITFYLLVTSGNLFDELTKLMVKVLRKISHPNIASCAASRCGSVARTDAGLAFSLLLTRILCDRDFDVKQKVRVAMQLCKRTADNIPINGISIGAGYS